MGVDVKFKPAMRGVARGLYDVKQERVDGARSAKWRTTGGQKRTITGPHLVFMAPIFIFGQPMYSCIGSLLSSLGCPYFRANDLHLHDPDGAATGGVSSHSRRSSLSEATQVLICVVVLVHTKTSIMF